MKTNREQFLVVFDLPKDTSLSLNEIASLSCVPRAALQEVYNRGIGAWKTNIASVRLKKDYSKNPNVAKYPRTARLGKEEWAFARVFAFVMGTDKVFGKADRDVAQRYRMIIE
jgi:hypothetical protein